MKATKNWYLPLDRMQPEIEKYVNSHPEWKPNVFGQCQSWLKQGLQARAMTRDLDWGVKVPLPDTEGKVLYVWFDAPIGYISMTKEWATDKGKNWEESGAFYRKRQYSFPLYYFPGDIDGRGKLYFARQCACQ